ncbi:MAG: FAD synthetase family protein [Erysipelotrichaceae bacterium]|nr:FAD synthetase family protein [Erysipelotrichaceae bacterium]
MINVIGYEKGIKVKRNVACIGYFDGVHKGHQELIRRTVELSRLKGLEACLITFKPDPDEVISGKKNTHINSFKKRIKLFEKFGISTVIVIPFDEKLMKMSPSVFHQKILSKLNIDTLTCGFDFTFAYKGQGKAKDLMDMGMKVEVVPELKYYGKKISSTRIKKALEAGNVSLAEKMLGYEYGK